MTLQVDELKQLANRIKIAMSDAEAETYIEQLNDMITFTNDLQEVDTTNVAPLTHPIQLLNVLRQDVPVDRLDREEMLKSVKEHEAGQIKVPTIL